MPLKITRVVGRLKKKVIAPIRVWKSKPLGFSQAILCEGRKLLFISGQVGIKSTGEVVSEPEGQIVQAFENLKNILEEAGAGFENVVKLTTYLTDMKLLPLYQEIRSKYIKDIMKEYPASTVVEVKGLARKELVVEIEAIAIL